MKRASIVFGYCFFGYDVSLTPVCAPRQAEKLRSSGLTKDLCVLSVIEILYLWKALANCSTETLQSMAQGTAAVGMLARVCVSGRRSFCFCLCAALQGVEDASCAGLKHLLLGAINKCLHNAKDAIQVCARSDETGKKRTHLGPLTNEFPFFLAVFSAGCR